MLQVNFKNYLIFLINSISTISNIILQIVQFSQTTTLTLPLPLGHGQTRGPRVSGQAKLSCFDPAVTGVGHFDSTSTLLPTLALAAPPQFADSPPDEVKRTGNVIN